jgi:hypothetical protein
MITCDFPANLGFIYQQDGDEWHLQHGSGTIVLWEKNLGKWEISYVDDEDYQHMIGKGDDEFIKNMLKQFKRDLLLNELLAK